MRAAIVGLCIFSLLASGCMQVSPWRVHERPWTPDVLTGASEVRATRSDGTTLVLEDATLDADATVLRGTLVSARDEAPVEIPIAQIALLESHRVEPRRIFDNVLLGVLCTVVVLFVVVGILFALNPSVGAYG